MGDVLKNGIIRCNGVTYRIQPLVRNLVCGQYHFTMKEAALAPGGIIEGEGDTGKSTFVRMFKEEVDALGPSCLIRLRDDDSTQHLLVASHDISKKRRDGQLCTVIIDGLDERPEVAARIIDLAEELSNDWFRIWVASRPGDALAQLNASGYFDKVYHLSPFTRDDFRNLAESVSMDGDDVLECINKATGSSSFITKPGGAVLMLELYASGKLINNNRSDLMRTIAMHFASESSGGRTKLAIAQKHPVPELINAAAWMATCLFCNGKESIATDEFTSENSLRFDDIPLNGNSREVMMAALERRLFEPLNGHERRPAYSAMLAYLAGTWIAQHPIIEHLQEMFPGPEKPFNAFMAEVISWIAIEKPVAAIEYIARRPEAFFFCHEAIRAFGCDRYFDVLLERCISSGGAIGESFEAKYQYSDLRGLNELYVVASSRFCKKDSRDMERALAARIMASTATSHQYTTTAETIINFIVDGSGDSKTRWYVSFALLQLCKNTLCSPELARLRQTLERPVSDFYDELVLGVILELLWPCCLPTKEMVKYLHKPISSIHGKYHWFLEEHLIAVLKANGTVDDIVALLEWAKSYWSGVGDRHHYLDLLCLNLVAHADKFDDGRVSALLAELRVIHCAKTGQVDIPPPVTECSLMHKIDDRYAWIDADGKLRAQMYHTHQPKPVEHIKDVIDHIDKDDEWVLSWLKNHFVYLSMPARKQLNDVSFNMLIKLFVFLCKHNHPLKRSDFEDMGKLNRNPWFWIMGFRDNDLKNQIRSRICPDTMQLLREAANKMSNRLVGDFVSEMEEVYSEKFDRERMKLGRLVKLCNVNTFCAATNSERNDGGVMLRPNKLIPVLERLRSVVDDACAHSKEGAFLFKRKEYVDAVMELWNNQSSAEYSVAFHDTKQVTEIWLAIRLGLIEYLKSIINGPKGVIGDFKSPGCHLLFERFKNANEDPHVLDLIPMKELFCTLKIEEKPRKTIKVKKPSSDKKRKEQEPQVDVDALPLKHYRFSFASDLKTIVDCEHQEPDYHIDPYLRVKKSAADIIDILIREAGKKKSEGWCKSQSTWRGRFTNHVCSRFKNEQIEVKRLEDGKFYWRIIPNEMFHEHYCKLFVSRKNW